MNRLLAIVGAILLLLVYAALMFHLLHGCPKIERPEWSPAEKAWVTQRMKMHGVWACEYDGKVYTFVRNGKVCKL